MTEQERGLLLTVARIMRAHLNQIRIKERAAVERRLGNRVLVDHGVAEWHRLFHEDELLLLDEVLQPFGPDCGPFDPSADPVNEVAR
jgi:hypothetical protein